MSQSGLMIPDAMADEHRKTILVVDDEPDVTELIEYKLRQSGYTVRAVNDPLRAIGLARDLRPDVVVLDVMMPELDGIRLLRMFRADSLLKDTPVILLTARSSPEDRVKGFETGADDYVPKPFEPRELLLRIQALLRRAKSAAARPDTRLAAGPVVLDVERHEVSVEGAVIDLTATEFKLLRLLLERKGRVQTRDALLSDVWNYDAELETRTVDTHVRRLREKLGAGSEIIETIRGVGYRVAG